MARTLARRLTVLVILMMIGCDEASVRISREAADRQADQNKQMATLQGEVSAAHRGLQAERSQLFSSWNSLESERKSIAGERRTESLLAALFSGGGATAAALIALALAWLTLFGLRKQDDSSEGVCELLMDDFVATPPKAGRPRLGGFPFRKRLAVDHNDSDRSPLPSTQEPR